MSAVGTDVHLKMNEKTFKTNVTRSSTDVIGFYDKYADTWDKRFGYNRSTSEFHRVRLESFLRLANLKSTDRIVELGVGTGRYLDILSPLVEKIICIDGSKRMLDVLRSKYQHLSNIELIEADLEKRMQETSFEADLVYCFGLLEHIIDINGFMTNCKNMLKRGGRVIVVTPNGRSPWYGGMRSFWRAGRHCSTDTYYTEEQLDDLMVRHGFALEAVIYWGYCPAGIGDALYWILNLAGRIVERTWFRRYAGGLTVRYVF